jgi:hypothetical protein
VLCNFLLAQWSEATERFFAERLQLTNYLSTGIVLLGLCVQHMRGNLSLRNYPRVGWLVLILFAFAFASIMWSFDPRYVWSSVWVPALPKLVFFVALAPLLIYRPADLRHGFIATLLLGSVLIALMFTTATWSGRGVVYETGGIYVNGSWRVETNPLAIGTTGATVALIATLFNFGGMAFVWRLLRWGLVALGMAVAFRSGSRGPVAGAVVAGLVALPISRRIRNWRGFAATVFGVVMVALTTYGLFTYFGEGRWSAASIDYDLRVAAATRLLNTWLESPLAWVVGLGNSASFSPQIYGFYTHIIPVEILCEEGLIGAILVVLILALTFRSFRRMYRSLLDLPIERGTLACLVAFIVFLMLNALSQGSLVGDPTFFAYAIIIGRFELGLRDEYASPSLAPGEFAGAWSGDGLASAASLDSDGAAAGDGAYGGETYDPRLGAAYGDEAAGW